MGLRGEKSEREGNIGILPRGTTSDKNGKAKRVGSECEK